MLVSMQACQNADMLTVAITNQKGGVGKTSTVVGVAAAMVRAGNRVLCVDLDPQADMTSWFGLDPLDDDQTNINDVIYSGAAGAAAAAVQPVSWSENLKCIGSTLDLAERETDLSPGAEFRLARVLEGVSDGYDVTLIDCPPSIGRLVVMALVAATHVVVVAEPSAASVRGVENVVKTMGVVREHYNRDLQFAGIVINHQSRTNESTLRIAELVSIFGESVWDPYVPARAVIAESMGARASVFDYGADGRAVSEVYDELAAHVAKLRPAAAAGGMH